MFVRPLLPLLLLAASAGAETVQLRKNGNVVSFEYITQDEDTITVQLPGKDTVLTYKWEDLDQDWVKKNQPKLWAERQLLIKPEDAPDKKMEKAKEEEADPFAKELPPADLKTLIKNLAASMQDGLKGIPVGSIEPLCKEADIEEATFWKAYDDLKKAGKVGASAGAAKSAETADKTEMKDGEKTDKEPAKDKKTNSGSAKTFGNKNSAVNRAREAQANAQRSSENKAREEAVKKDLENDVRAFNGLGYLRMLTETGPKARLTWSILRRSAEDRRTVVTALRKYESQAGQLAEKADLKDKGEALSLKKTIANAADSLEKVTRESTTMDGRLQGDCQALLLKITPFIGR